MARIINDNLIAELARVTCEEMIPDHLEANLAEDARVESAMLNMGLIDEATLTRLDALRPDDVIPF